MIFDTHVHSIMSADSDTPPDVAIRTAEQLSIGIVFTEHVDYDMPVGQYNFVTDVERYLSEYQIYKGNRVLTGLEIGLTTESIKRNVTLSNDERLDYVIGSVHMVNGLDIYTDFYEQGISERETYIQYLCSVMEMVQQNVFFDSLGHIDYPSRYSVFENKLILYDEYHEYYDAILKTLIEKSKCIEINTAYLWNRTAAGNLMRIYSRYYELGGRAVTIGSDAHAHDNIGRSFSEALSMCKSIGLRPVYFEKRKMISCE